MLEALRLGGLEDEDLDPLGRVAAPVDRDRLVAQPRRHLEEKRAHVVVPSLMRIVATVSEYRLCR